jgi:uncharacterized protein
VLRSRNFGYSNSTNTPYIGVACLYYPIYWVYFSKNTLLCLVLARRLDLDCYLCYNAEAFLVLRLQGGAQLNLRHPLRLNVGFLLNESIGCSRNVEYNVDSVQLGEDLKVNALQGSLDLTRTSLGILVEGSLQGKLSLECVRCLNSFDQNLTGVFEDLFVYPASRADDPLLAIPETAVLDLTPVLREYLLLDVPIQPLCRPDCKGLCPICGELITDKKCDHHQDEIDPRFEVLRALLPKS